MYSSHFHRFSPKSFQVSLYALEEALEGRIRQIPFNAIQALDVVMRHLVTNILALTLNQPNYCCFLLR